MSEPRRPQRQPNPLDSLQFPQEFTFQVPPTTILRLPRVKTRTGLSRSTIYVRVAAGALPGPVAVDARAVGWLEPESETWFRGRI